MQRTVTSSSSTTRASVSHPSPTRLGIFHFRRGDRKREEPEVRERQEQNSVFSTWQSCFTRDVRAVVRLSAQGLLKPPSTNIAVWGGEAFPNLHPKLKGYWQLIAARGGRINLHWLCGFWLYSSGPTSRRMWTAQIRVDRLLNNNKKRIRNRIVRKVRWLQISKHMRLGDYDQNTLFEILKEWIVFNYRNSIVLEVKFQATKSQCQLKNGFVLISIALLPLCLRLQSILSFVHFMPNHFIFQQNSYCLI